MEKNKLVTIGVIVALVLVGAYLLMGNQPTVRAQGESTIEVIPDKVSVYLVIETRNESQSVSQLENTRIAERVREQLSFRGVAAENIQFSGFSSYPEYDYTNGRSVPIGFVTRQDVIVEVSDFAHVSDVVTAGIAGGAYVSTISLELSQDAQSRYKIQAIEAASIDARAKAEAQARGLGKRLGGLVAVESQDFNYYPMPYYARGGEGVASTAELDEAKAAAASIAPREVDVSAHVIVTYRLQAF